MPKICQPDEAIFVKAPYNSVFEKSVQQLGGTWQNPEWQFALAHEQAVLDACYHAYGDDGTRKNQVDVKYSIVDSIEKWDTPIHVFGRTIARAHKPDAWSDDDTNIVDNRAWSMLTPDKTIFVIHNVSRALVDEFENDEETEVEILDGGSPTIAELLEEKQAFIESAAELDERLMEKLQAERELIDNEEIPDHENPVILEMFEEKQLVQEKLAEVEQRIMKKLSIEQPVFY